MKRRARVAIEIAIAFGVAACALDPDGQANLVQGDAAHDSASGSGGVSSGGSDDGSMPDAADASGGCGQLAESCCASAKPCKAGACLAGVCTEFAGGHSRSLAPECGAQPCTNGNPLAGDLCACPVGFLAQTMLVKNDCWPSLVAAELTFCRASTTYPQSDWAGAFQQVFPGTPCVPEPDGCIAPNPYTNLCSCPAGATAIQLPVDVPTCNHTSHAEGQITLCWNASAPRVSFDGAYLFDDIAPPCTAPNPATADCTCPSGNPKQALRMIRSVASAPRGTTLYVCHP